MSAQILACAVSSALNIPMFSLTGKMDAPRLILFPARWQYEPALELLGKMWTP